MNVIYDSKGTIFYCGEQSAEGNIGQLSVDVPEGKYINGVDVSANPPIAILKDYQKSETELLKEEVELLKGSVIEMSKDVYN